ncbi:MAG: cytochrome c [Saprospiraceae bacterium]|nr:cytochrome c [Saprospiraceae bacterium]
MKNLSSLYYLLFIITASIIVSSCGLPNGNFPGSEYMPDMAHSIAYEATVNSYYYQNTWGGEDAYRLMAKSRKPVKGTIARGFLPFKYQNLEDFRTSADETHVVLQEKVRTLIMEDPTIVNPIKPTSADELGSLLQKGADLYSVACQVCHGEEGDGNGVLYNDGNGKYTAKPANFLSEDFLDAPDGQFINAIMHGKGMMQSHSDKLTPDERWTVIHYIRSLQAVKKGAEYNPVVEVNVSPSLSEPITLESSKGNGETHDAH